jgi:regulator of nonsense transcripts 2
MPELPIASAKTDSIQIGNGPSALGADGEDIYVAGSKWEDEEERRFFEDIQDLKDFVPRAVLGVEEEVKLADGESDAEDAKGKEEQRREQEKLDEEVRKMEAQLEGLAKTNGVDASAPSAVADDATEDDDE